MAKDDNRTRAQLISELEELRRRVAELEALDAEHTQMENALRASSGIRSYSNSRQMPTT